MYISTRGQVDVLVKEKNESFLDFTKVVVRYAKEADLTVKDFCKMVSVENVTLEEAAVIYGTIYREVESSNVIRFEERKMDQKVIRFPLWSKEAIG